MWDYLIFNSILYCFSSKASNQLSVGWRISDVHAFFLTTFRNVLLRGTHLGFALLIKVFNIVLQTSTARYAKEKGEGRDNGTNQVRCSCFDFNGLWAIRPTIRSLTVALLVMTDATILTGWFAGILRLKLSHCSNLGNDLLFFVYRRALQNDWHVSCRHFWFDRCRQNWCR